MINKITAWWQHIPEHINPVFVQMGTFEIKYYGLMYLFAFFTVYVLVLYRLRNERWPFSKDMINDYFFWAVLGVLLGGRLGYVVFYNWGYFFRNPWEIIIPFSFRDGFSYTGISGMSYHGGLIGLGLATWLFCLRHKLRFWPLSNLIAPAVPLGYTFGRVGNFINGELYGRITDMPWGMYFPSAVSNQLRHPSQLYEALFEGVILFVFLWSIRNKKTLANFSFSLYLIGYGFVRFFIEFFREPDPQLGFVLSRLTMGQVLCLIMIIVGFIVFIWRFRNIQRLKKEDL